MEASALTHGVRFGRLGRRSPLLRLQGDERLIALIRAGHERAFEALVERYSPRLHAFCRGMVGSSEDAEDLLQEVFVAAHKAILADNRPINARPWLYRIARNRCLNHLRKPVPEGQDSMDVHMAEHGASVGDRVQKREDFRALLRDVRELPETQRTALLMREIDALTYEEIAQAMTTTVPAVKSLLVRARMSLADASHSRHLTCDEVHLELAEAAEGLRRISGPLRVHLRRCERCRGYRGELRGASHAVAALAPAGALVGLQQALAAKLGAAGAGAGATVGAGGAAGGIGGALGAKALAGVASVALLTAGAVEVRQLAGGGGEGAGGGEQTFMGPILDASPAAVAGPRHATGHPARSGAADAPARAAASSEAAVGDDAAEAEGKAKQPVGATTSTEEPAPPSDSDEVEASPDAVAGGAQSGSGVGTGNQEGSVVGAPPTSPEPWLTPAPADGAPTAPEPEPEPPPAAAEPPQPPAPSPPPEAAG